GSLHPEAVRHGSQHASRVVVLKRVDRLALVLANPPAGRKRADGVLGEIGDGDAVPLRRDVGRPGVEQYRRDHEAHRRCSRAARPHALTRSRPAALARYRASSAQRVSFSGLAPSGGKAATPMLSVGRTIPPPQSMGFALSAPRMASPSSNAASRPRSGANAVNSDWMVLSASSLIATLAARRLSRA